MSLCINQFADMFQITENGERESKMRNYRKLIIVNITTKYQLEPRLGGVFHLRELLYLF